MTVIGMSAWSFAAAALRLLMSPDAADPSARGAAVAEGLSLEVCRFAPLLHPAATAMAQLTRIALEKVMRFIQTSVIHRRLHAPCRSPCRWAYSIGHGRST